MERFNIKLAGHTVGIETEYSRNRAFFSDYMTDDEDSPEFVASLTEDEVDRIAQSMPSSPRRMAELTGLYRPIAEAMPMLGGFVFHGAAISYGGKGYIFTAPSGTGKSTHIKLWHKYLGSSVDIINGDKPIITVEDGLVRVHGTPWAGKELWQKNRSAELGGICLLRRGDYCRAGIADTDEALSFLLGQTYLSPDPEITGRTMELLDSLLRAVPVYYLYCDMSEEAVKCSFEALCKESFDIAKAKNV